MINPIKKKGKKAFPKGNDLSDLNKKEKKQTISREKEKDDFNDGFQLSRGLVYIWVFPDEKYLKQNIGDEINDKKHRKAKETKIKMNDFRIF